jgi:hypothetical protein
MVTNLIKRSSSCVERFQENLICPLGAGSLRFWRPALLVIVTHPWCHSMWEEYEVVLSINMLDLVP